MEARIRRNEKVTLWACDQLCAESLYLMSKAPLSPLSEHDSLPFPVIASLTTYPKRINVVEKVILSLFHQTARPSKIELYLSIEDFPGKEKDLPTSLLKYVQYGLSIIWVPDNLKCHKKYFYAMRNHPNDVIITFDDDVFYSCRTVESLLLAHLQYPQAIIARRAHRIKCDETGSILPYKDWEWNTHKINEPRMDLVPTGVGGVLYPPHSLHQDLYNVAQIKSIALNEDDLWLKLMSVLQGTYVVSIQEPFSPLIYLPGSQEEGLWEDNVQNGENDKCLSALLSIYNTLPDGTPITSALIKED